MASRNPAKWMAVALVALSVSSLSSEGSTSEGVPTRGVVKDVDAANAEVTIDHEDIPGLMMAMTMTFSVADPAQLRGIEKGQQVDFKVKKEGGRYVVTEIRLAEDQGAQQSPQPHGCMMNMEKCGQRMDAMRSHDDELAKLVSAMKSAEGAAKVDAVAAVVEALVEQRQAMHAQMGCGMMH